MLNAVIHSTKNNRRVPFIINCLRLIKRYTPIKPLCNKLLYSVLRVLIVRFIWIGASAGFRQDFRLRKSGEKCTVFGLANSFRKFVVTSNDK